MTGESGAALTGAEALLARMKARGVDCVFGNAGTDFPSLIEAFASTARSGLDLPRPVLVPHETVGVGMAHGFALATGRAQAVIVHVNVGLANAICGVINAATDGVPLLMCSGRTPITEHGHHGSRTRAIHWGQEMRDQAAMLREAVKWDYELRYPEQAEIAAERALAIAASDPKGPVYLSLPREVLAAPVPEGSTAAAQVAAASGPAPAGAVAEAVSTLATAKHPVIITQRGVGDSRALAALADHFAIPVVEFWATRNALSTDHPMYVGGDPTAWIERADVVIGIDTLVPYDLNARTLAFSGRTISIGPDPLYTRTPMRGFPVDVALAGDPVATLELLHDRLLAAGGTATSDDADWRGEIAESRKARHAARDAAIAKGAGAPMSAAYVSRCLSDAKADDAAIFNELGVDPAMMDFDGPDRFYSTSLAGGLGWALPAALGYQLASPDREVIACIGDGSYIFANPVACHMTAMAEALPVLTILFNNGIWNAVRRATVAMYPKGEAVTSNAMPLIDLKGAPDYPALARAHGLWGERCDNGADLPGKIADALRFIREEKKPALLEVVVS